MTDGELTAIYNEANGVGRKNPPITTERIFAAMRLVEQKTREECARLCDRFADRDMHPRECAAAIRGMK